MIEYHGWKYQPITKRRARNLLRYDNQVYYGFTHKGEFFLPSIVSIGMFDEVNSKKDVQWYKLIKNK
jgi:hypothetical protein